MYYECTPFIICLLIIEFDLKSFPFRLLCFFGCLSILLFFILLYNDILIWYKRRRLIYIYFGFFMAYKLVLSLLEMD